MAKLHPQSTVVSAPLFSVQQLVHALLSQIARLFMAAIPQIAGQLPLNSLKRAGAGRAGVGFVHLVRNAGSSEGIFSPSLRLFLCWSHHFIGDMPHALLSRLVGPQRPLEHRELLVCLRLRSRAAVPGVIRAWHCRRPGTGGLAAAG